MEQRWCFCGGFAHIFVFVFVEEAFDNIPAGITEPRNCSATESKNTEPEKSSSSIGE